MTLAPKGRPRWPSGLGHTFGDIEPPAARPGPPQLVRRAGGRRALQRATRVPGRRRARPGRGRLHLRALPGVPRGHAGQGPLGRGERPGAGRRWPIELGVGEVLLLGRGEEASGGRAKASILADAFEAILGAVYLDGGLATPPSGSSCASWRDAIAAAGEEPDDFDHKSRLQEKAVRTARARPATSWSGSGPDHDRAYVAEVYVAGTALGDGRGAIQEGRRAGGRSRRPGRGWTDA